MFWIRDHRVARKPHVCSLCRRRIDKGETYLYGTGHEDAFWHWKECAHCEWMQTTFDISDDGMYSDEMLAGFEPRNMVELRAVAGYRMKWRTKMGNLLPVPTLLRQRKDADK